MSIGRRYQVVFTHPRTNGQIVNIFLVLGLASGASSASKVDKKEAKCMLPTCRRKLRLCALRKSREVIRNTSQVSGEGDDDVMGNAPR